MVYGCETLVLQTGCLALPDLQNAPAYRPSQWNGHGLTGCSELLGNMQTCTRRYCNGHFALGCRALVLNDLVEDYRCAGLCVPPPEGCDACSHSTHGPRSPARSMPGFAGPASPPERLSLYVTKQRNYVIGSWKSGQEFRLLKVSRHDPNDLDFSEDPGVYSKREINALTAQIHNGNLHNGGLQKVCEVLPVCLCDP